MIFLFSICHTAVQANSAPPQHNNNAAEHQLHFYIPNNSAALSTPQSNFGWMYLNNCLPMTVQFMDSSFATGAGIQHWNWKFGDGTSTTDQEPLHDYTSNGSYLVTLTVTDSTGAIDSIQKTLIVNTSTPSVHIGNDTTVCQGSIVTLDASIQSGCSYYWNTGATTQTIQVNASGDYWVQVYNSTCSATSTIHVTVLPPLAADFNYNQVSACAPLSVQFTDASASCTNSIISRQWDFGDGGTSNLSSPLHVFADSGNYIVRLTVADNTGRQVTTNKSIYITNTSAIVILGNDTTICSGNTLALQAGNGYDTYLWNNGATTASIDVSDPGTYWVQVSKSGCTGRDSIQVNIIFPLVSRPGAVITSQCLPVLVHFTDSSEVVCGSSSINYWLWDFGDGSSAVLQHPNHTYLQAGTYSVRLTIRNSQGKTITASKQIEIKTTGPVVDYGVDITICRGSSIPLDAGNPGGVFSWSPSQFLSDPAIQTPIASPLVTTLFVATIKKCGLEVKDSIMMFVDSVAKPSIFSLDGGFLASSPAVAYQWYKNGKAIGSATRRNLKPLGAGYYQVEQTNDRGCRGISDGYFYLPAGGQILPGIGKIKVKISPNPTSGMINIYLSSKPDRPVSVDIYDTFGRNVYKGSASNNINTINLSNLGRAYYWVKLSLNNQKVTIPIIVQ